VLFRSYTILCNCASNAINVYLPAAITCTDRIYNIKKTDASSNYVNIIPYGSQSIDTSTSVVVTKQGSVYTVQSDGSNWQII
jgi:hypothetical protein